jgi:hypothetical protein
MKYPYEPFVIRKFATNRIFEVNPKMPFEMVVDCFYVERPFFLISRLVDGRIAVTPNPTVVPLSLFQAGNWPCDLFPTEWEYGTIKNQTYPVIVTAHAIPNFDEWCTRFENNVVSFAKKTLAEHVTASKEFLPLDYEHETYKKISKPMAKEAQKI